MFGVLERHVQDRLGMEHFLMLQRIIVEEPMSGASQKLTQNTWTRWLFQLQSKKKMARLRGHKGTAFTDPHVMVVALLEHGNGYFLGESSNHQRKL